MESVIFFIMTCFSDWAINGTFNNRNIILNKDVFIIRFEFLRIVRCRLGLYLCVILNRNDSGRDNLHAYHSAHYHRLVRKYWKIRQFGYQIFITPSKRCFALTGILIHLLGYQDGFLLFFQAERTCIKHPHQTSGCMILIFLYQKQV